MTEPNPKVNPLKGYLRMLQVQVNVEEPLSCHPFDGDRLQETQTRLERRKKSTDGNHSSLATEKSFADVLKEHRFVCFFIVQGNNKRNFHSNHTLTLRKRLALKFRNLMTTLIVFCDDKNDSSSQGEPLFCQGTGFTSFPSSPTLMSILNITQVPSLIVLDTITGRPIHPDSALALEWNYDDPRAVLDAWEQGQSGLSSTQKVTSVVTLQSTSCAIS